MEGWADGAFSTESSDGTIQLNSEAIGKAYLLKDLLDVSYETIVEELANNE
jgi:hypothetical protein